MIAIIRKLQYLTFILLLSVNPSTVFADSAGRLLASQCAQCHGTDGKSSTGIDSLEANEIVEELKEYQASADADDIMKKQAHGYNDAEIALIANYFASLPGASSNDGDDDDDNDDDDDGDDDDDDD